jgi:tol-pal system protein YbgF
MISAFKKIRLSVLLLVLLVTAGLSPGFAQTTLTPEQISLRLEGLGKTSAALSEIQLQMKDLNEDVDRMGRLIDNRGMLEMLQRVEELSDEISNLTGAIEQQGHDIDDIKKRQRELYLDVDRRLRDLESGAAAQAQGGPITIPKVKSTTQGSLPEITTSTGQQTATTEPASTTSQTITASTQIPSATQSQEKAAYQAAFDTLKEGRYKKAKTQLKTFLGKYPKSSFAGNAQYWLGEAHYVTRNFSQGIIEFEKVLAVYGSSNKVPDAMLKLGYTNYELKQFDQAKVVLQELRKRYPKSTAARLAAKRLDRIRKEGY